MASFLETDWRPHCKPEKREALLLTFKFIELTNTGDTIMNDLKWKDHIYSLSERSPFLFIVFILEVFHCERTMDLSLMHLQSTGSPSTAASSIKWRSLGKIWSGHLALFGYMTLICFFNIVLSCSNYLTQVNNISNLSRRTKFRGFFFFL